jgi:replicative DNA helicase
MEKNKNDLPKRYLENRDILEGKCILSYYKNTALLDEFPLNSKEDLILDESRILYDLVEKMYNKGIVDVDIISMESFLESLPETKEQINSYGGVRQILAQAKAINITNFESYYDELCKNNYLIDFFLVQKDLNSRFEVMKNEMDSQQVADLTEFLIGNINNTTIGKKATHNDFYLSDSLINEIVNGEFIKTISFGEYARILDSIFNGLPESCVTLFSGLSGSSKSTFTVSNVIYPIIRAGHKVLLISNELSFKQYMLMFLTIILTRELGYYKITRDKLNKAKLTDEDIKKIKEAQEIINNKYDKPIHFIDMNTSSAQEVIRAIRKYSKLGYYLTVYDTAKPDSSISDGTGQAWQRSLEMIKELTYVTQETKTHLWLPYQIANSADYKRRLSRMDLAEAKNIITMITNHGILRKLKPEEKDPSSKYYCNPYRLTYNEQIGKWIKEKIQLEDDKKYVVVFIDKTRFNEDGQYLLYEFNGAWSIYREVGMCLPVADTQKGN